MPRVSAGGSVDGLIGQHGAIDGIALNLASLQALAPG